MARELFAPDVTIWDISKRIAHITNACTVLYTDPVMMKNNAWETCSYIRRKTSSSNRNHLHLPHLESHLHRLSKNPVSLLLNPITKTAILPHHSNHLTGLQREDGRERNQRGKRYRKDLTGV